MDKILILFLILSLLNANGEQFVGEKLTYSAGFRIFSAGGAQNLFFSPAALENRIFFACGAQNPYIFSLGVLKILIFFDCGTLKPYFFSPAAQFLILL